MARRSRFPLKAPESLQPDPRPRGREPLRADQRRHPAGALAGSGRGPHRRAGRPHLARGRARSSCGCRPASGPTSCPSWPTRCARGSRSGVWSRASCASAWARSRPVERPPERRIARAVPVVREVPAELARVLATVTDPELRQAIESAAAANLAWQIGDAARPAGPAHRSAASRSSPSIRWIRKRSAGPNVACFSRSSARYARRRTTSIALTLRNALLSSSTTGAAQGRPWA